MSGKSHLKGILIFSSRMDLRDAMRAALKKAKMPECDIKAIAFLEQFLEEMDQDDRSLLVLDWEAGEDKVLEILGKAQTTFTTETRPILMLAKQSSEKLMAIGYEYHVSRVYCGEISMDKLKELFESMGQDEALNSPLRSVISGVNQKRNLGDWAGANKILEEIRAKVPDNPKVLTELAENKFQNDMWKDALSLLEPLIDLDPPYIRALHILGRCYMKLGQFDKASGAFKRAKITNPFNVDRLVLLGQCLLQENKTKEARQNFDEASQLQPESREARVGISSCMLLEGEINEALALMKNMSNSRELAAIFNSSAILAMRRGDYSHGMKLYDSAMGAIKGDVKVKARLHFNKGIGYCRWHRESEAITCFELAWKSDLDFEKAKRNYLSLAKKLGVAVTVGQEVPDQLAPASSPEPGDQLADMDETIDGSLNLDLSGASDLNIDFDDDLEDESLSFL